MQIEMKLHIFPSVQQLRQIATVRHKLRLEMGLLNTSLCEVVEAGEDDPGEGDVLGHVEVEAEDVAEGLDDDCNDYRIL